MTQILGILSVLALFAAGVLGWKAYDAWQDTQNIRLVNARTRTDINGLVSEIQSIQPVDPWPLLFTEDALSAFVTRSIEAGEVLGAGTRVAGRDQTGRGRGGSGPIACRDYRHGLRVCPVSLQVAMMKDSAATILAFLEEELLSMPVSLERLQVRAAGGTASGGVTVTADIDVFGRAQ